MKKDLKKIQVIYATMTADLFHRGHLEFIKKIRGYGDFLIIGLHPDDIVEAYKRKPIMPYKHRREILMSIKYVDMVVADCLHFRRPSFLENIKKYSVNYAVHAGTWIPDVYLEAEKQGLCKVIKTKYYLPNLSTTNLIKKIKEYEN